MSTQTAGCRKQTAEYYTISKQIKATWHMHGWNNVRSFLVVFKHSGRFTCYSFFEVLFGFGRSWCCCFRCWSRGGDGSQGTLRCSRAIANDFHYYCCCHRQHHCWSSSSSSFPRCWVNTWWNKYFPSDPKNNLQLLIIHQSTIFGL